MNRAIFENEKVNLRYLYYYLLLHRADLVEQGIGGAQPNISQTILKKLPVSYPVDKNEQERIVTLIEEQMETCDSIRRRLEESLFQTEVFKLSILKNAFEEKAKEWVFNYLLYPVETMLSHLA